MVKGYYVSTLKQEMHQDEAAFVKKYMLPHTQVCYHCNMVLEISAVKDIEFLPGSVGYVTCPGCYKYVRFSGGEHLQRELRKEVMSRMSQKARIREPNTDAFDIFMNYSLAFVVVLCLCLIFLGLTVRFVSAVF